MFEITADDPVVNEPPPLSKIIFIPLACKGSFYTLLNDYTDKKIMEHIISPLNFSLSERTPVEDALKKIITELRWNAEKLTPAWRWKIMKMMPVNFINKTNFLIECKVTKEIMKTVIKAIYTIVFPQDLLGAGNDDMFIDFLLQYVYSDQEQRKKLHYPKLFIKQSLIIRAMRSPGFRKKLKESYCSLNIIQKSSMVYINHFVLKICISMLFHFVHATYPSPYVLQYYSKRGFNFWRKKEMKTFKQDYQLEKVNEGKECPTHLISHTRIAVSGISMRPICPFRKSTNWKYSNDLQLINKALDFYVQSYGQKRIQGLHFEIRYLKRYLGERRKNFPGTKLYFIKADVSKCYANMKRDLLDTLLRRVVGSRVAYVAYTAVYGSNGKVFRLMGVGPDEETAEKELNKRKQKHNVVETYGKMQFKKFTPMIVDEIMTRISQLRFTIISKSKQLYRMGKGVPQGCVLSSRLSHIYLSDFDDIVIKPLMTPGSRMFRYADDYLIILDSKDKAVRILEQLQRPNNAHGLHFRKEKTQTSFTSCKDEKPLKEIIWCGTAINARENRVVCRTRKSPLPLVLRKTEMNFDRFATFSQGLVQQQVIWTEFEKICEREFNEDDKSQTSRMS